jgi:hypothetical protein
MVKFTSIFSIALFCILFENSLQIFFVLDPFEQRCISKEMQEKSNFSGVYFISGEREDGNKAMIKNSRGQIIWENHAQKSGSFNLYVQSTEAYSLCIESTVNQQLTISFEFYDEKKDEQLISVQSIDNLNSAIHGIRRKLDIIHGNIRNSAVRRSTHLESKINHIKFYIVSNTITSKITFYTAVKIIFLIIFSIFQILMLTSIFGNVKVTSKIQMTESSPNKPFVDKDARENIFL